MAPTVMLSARTVLLGLDAIGFMCIWLTMTTIGELTLIVHIRACTGAQTGLIFVSVSFIHRSS